MCRNSLRLRPGLVLLVVVAVRPLSAQGVTGQRGRIPDMPGMSSSQPMGDLDAFYGRYPVGYWIFLRLRPAAKEH